MSTRLDRLEAASVHGAWRDWCRAATADNAYAFMLTAADDLVEAMPLLLAVARAAEPFARLPFPVSSRERNEWRLNVSDLRDALDALAVSADADASPDGDAL